MNITQIASLPEFGVCHCRKEFQAGEEGSTTGGSHHAIKLRNFPVRF